jgi:hypothetical protein
LPWHILQAESLEIENENQPAIPADTPEKKKRKKRLAN